MTMNNEDNGLSQATAWYQSIAEAVEKLKTAQDASDWDAADAADQEILEMPLSVEVRSGWHVVGGGGRHPAEYRILLCTGGPAVQIIGELSEYAEPITARMQYQDWFTPWTDAATIDAQNVEAMLLTFARRFYFGEG